jgi:hypothetical protein
MTSVAAAMSAETAPKRMPRCMAPPDERPVGDARTVKNRAGTRA